ncbi:AAA family ATPase [Glaciimonas sp. Gout2]|uniref:AAA family ATPase n=1 Tax=Glaciimonas sp. Gout2 TaxID=3048625 RepID=UPI002B22B371|nr:AAA family ATPase [Glaciimonas sp. Gout2]MEB0082320.1 AAA family ATPase [Glaciimonas sp. Gout2]
MLEKLELKNFAKFSDLPIKFSPRINIVIGENGTGKTQLLKAAYAANAALSDELQGTDLAKRLCRIYRPTGDSLGKLVRHGTPVGAHAEIDAQFAGGQRLQARFTSASKTVALPGIAAQPSLGAPLFLPTKEVLSLLRGIKSKDADLKTIESIFDSTYLDLCEKLMAKKPLKAEDVIESDPRFGAVYEKLVNALEGRFSLTDIGGSVLMSFDPGQYQVQRDKDQHDLNTRMQAKFLATKGESISANMAAEGIRKLGILQLLLQNRQLDPGRTGTLFWDEPETNMNPKLMKLLVEILLELSRNGQQIILATHDYVLLKWFDLLVNKGQGDHIRFHALSTENGQVVVQTADDYRQLNNNAIANTFNDLYDEEIKRSLGGA